MTSLSASPQLLVGSAHEQNESSQETERNLLIRDRGRNVRLVYWYTFWYTIFQSISQWRIFDAYLALLAEASGSSNPNTWIGFAEGITGMTTLILALPLGQLADTYDRIRLIRISGVLGFVTASISAFSYAYDNIFALYTNLFFWGIFTGLQGTAMEAVFADSVDVSCVFHSIRTDAPAIQRLVLPRFFYFALTFHSEPCSLFLC